MLSFSVVTLLGSALLSLLHLPQDAIRWVALVALVAIGLGLIFPRFEQVLERPFARIPQKQIATRGNGFGLGLALGVLYVPCAGPVLAAIVVAGATANIGLRDVVLTAGFRVGAAVPLLFFALAGQRITERVSAFRRRQREIRITRRHRDDPAGGGTGVQSAGGAAAGHPGLHRSLQRTSWRRATMQVEAKLGGIVNDQNTGVVELPRRVGAAAEAAAPHPTSRASSHG